MRVRSLGLVFWVDQSKGDLMGIRVGQAYAGQHGGHVQTCSNSLIPAAHLGWVLGGSVCSDKWGRFAKPRWPVFFVHANGRLCVEPQMYTDNSYHLIHTVELKSQHSQVYPIEISIYTPHHIPLQYADMYQ